MGDEVDDKNYKGDPFSDFAFDIFAKSEMCISTSKSNATLEFVPEEKRLLIDDEDDQFFFRSDGSCRFVKTSTARILNLLSVAL